MKKEIADRIITEYLPKLYGFAVKKCFTYSEAEDLCSEIVFEVYRSLLKSEEIINVEGYIWRISEHTYAKYVSSKKKCTGVSINETDIPYYDEYDFENTDAEMEKLRLEVAFLSKTRRRIVYLFYFGQRSVSSIAAELGIPEGTVKWHLNKARNELKEGLSMERKIGKLGLSPLEASSFGHGGRPGKNGGPEYYLEDKINLNIVYSVYDSPKTREEIAEELGITLVYIEDKIDMLESNGFLVKTKNNKYTTYVEFAPRTYSLEQKEVVIRTQLEIAEILAKEYVPIVREAVASVEEVYIPSGNRELLEAAVIFWAIVNRCGFEAEKDLSKYVINTTDGGRYRAYVDLYRECSDPDYVPTLKDLPNYWACGDMTRGSEKYTAVYSWSIDTRLCSRTGTWQNNLTEDYEYIYELLKGDISENDANSEKFARLRERRFLTADGKLNIMIAKGTPSDLFDRIPAPDPAIRDKFIDKALECAMIEAKNYPPQMQDLIVSWTVREFAGTVTALMVMDILYSDGTFKPLTEEEKTASTLIMFSDILPQD